MEAIPVQYRDIVGGPSLKVDVHTGAFAEGLLTFLITFACLSIIVKGPRNVILQAWLLALVMVVLVMSGIDYTGLP
ncbi:hypothetical protein SLEP1_g24527 [Rubroshorea leprosula]|uniref:Uncharacterized protein n=1 Tax=Rubroshorea leprosula TaxID=152421 RepID=A0AAV5JM90_9ROSI|nr:hypothetical protein SLEP1_g24527 [Rubroshorea leprosula]